MSARRESVELEKTTHDVVKEPASLGDHLRGRQFSVDAQDRAVVVADQNMLHRDLKGRHMQMIAM